MITAKRQTNETLRRDIWRACDILHRDRNVGGAVQDTVREPLICMGLDENTAKVKPCSGDGGEMLRLVSG